MKTLTRTIDITVTYDNDNIQKRIWNRICGTPYGLDCVMKANALIMISVL